MNRMITAHLPRPRHIALMLTAGLLAACGQDARELGESSALGLDLQRPDALIESASLSRLPKDLLAVPLLRDTLTEDFVFYYEHNADRLGLVGSLRRIIYERDLKLRDNLLDELLDQPAEVALWKGADGKLKHFLMVIQRGGLAKVLEPLAHVALDDSQLSQAGELRVGGSSVPLYRLNYLGDRALLLASHGDQLLVLSSPGMLFGDDDKLGRPATESVEALLDGDNLFAKRFGLKPRDTEQQRISLSGEYIALGYQRFFPAFAGVRFEKAEAGWSSFLALNEVDDQPAMDFTPIWTSMPMGASACFAVPVAPGSAEKLLARVGVSDATSESLYKRLGSSAGLCWYADSRLHSPLLVTHLDEAPSAEFDQAIGGLFDGMIGAFEPNAENGRFAVQSQSTADGHLWRREVGSNFGPYPAEQATNPEALASRGFFRVSLARQGQTLLFSLDDRLVDKALDTLGKRFPPLADVLPADGLVPGYLAPEGLSRLLEQETLDSLPANYEPVFRNAADIHLLPKLRALGGYGQFALTLPKGSEADDDWKWVPLEWRSL